MRIIDVTAENVEETGFTIVLDGEVLSHYCQPLKILNELLVATK